ncbi:MAG: hypothetical protein VX498_03180, partial [Myxococcota bacterium]|nr:hypothetical protein [Myxococcota bacterium]
MVHVPIQYSNLLDFLEDYRAHISGLNYTIPTSEPLKVGDEVEIAFSVPGLGETVQVSGRVVHSEPDRAGVEIAGDVGDGLPRLEGFFRFVGQIVEQMLLSGRFKVAAPWAPGAAPAMSPAAGAPPPQAGDPQAPLSERVTVGAPTRSGAVSEEGLTEALMGLYKERATGVFEVRSDLGRRMGWLKSGGFVQWENDPVIEEECLGVLLTRAGKMSEKQLRDSLKMMNETGKKQGECLIEMGVLTFPKLVMSLLTQVEIITRNVFGMTTGTWSFSPAERLPADLITPVMKMPGFLFDYYKRRITNLPQAQLEERQAPLLDRYTQLSSEVNWDDMRMKKVERGLIEILEKKSYRYRSVFTISNMGRNKTVPVLLALADLKVLSFVDSEDSTQVDERLRSQLTQKTRHQTDQNPFEVLEIHWTSQSEQVEAGYKKIRAEYEKFGSGRDLPEDVEQMR